MISERAHKVLNQVVTLHYRTCGPVGSKLISRTRAIPFSPATIRNIMGRLEKTGHLAQPHTSAGRVPTDLGYRTYVNEIKLNRQPLGQDERAAFSSLLDRSAPGPGILKAVSDFLHARTGLVTFYVPFYHSGLPLKHIHFERLGPDRLLVLWVSPGGHSYQSVLPVDEQTAGERFVQKIENFMNNAYTGMSLLDIQRRLQLDAGREADLLAGKVAQITQALAKRESQLDHFQHQGVGGLLDMPEFRNVDEVRRMIEILERPAKIQALIRQAVASNHEWVLFFIGQELDDPELENLGIVLAKMTANHRELGIVGIVGPKRLPYLRSLQILAFAKDRLANRA